jgi:hypothetical protein
VFLICHDKNVNIKKNFVGALRAKFNQENQLSQRINQWKVNFAIVCWVMTKKVSIMLALLLVKTKRM